MRVQFVAIGTEQLPVSLLAAILRRAGHQVGLAFSRHLFDDQVLSIPWLARLFNDEAQVLDQIVRFRPDVVCFSALTMNYRWMLALAEKTKAACGATVVFGGVHPSAVPDVVLEEPVVDFVCVGEGDIALPLLLEALAKGPVDGPLPNVAFRGRDGRIVHGARVPFLQDLDRLPGFEKDLWVDHIPMHGNYMTMSSRGCPYRCSFCFNSFFAKLPGDRDTAGRYVRQRSVDHFLEELREAKRRYGIRFVQIEDDVFTLDAGWMREFAVRYRREIGVPFQCLSHPQFLDAEKVTALKEAGCCWVEIGVQSADDDYKKSRLRRYEGNGQVEKALDLLEKAGIRYSADHIFGFQDEPVDAQEDAREFYARRDPARINTFWLNYYPGTELQAVAVREGFLTREEADRLNRGYLTSYYSDRTVADPRRRRQYAAYEALFRWFPLLPAPVRRRLRTGHVSWLPAPVLKRAGLLADLTSAALQNNRDFRRFFLQMGTHLENHFRWRFRLGPRRRYGPPPDMPVSDPRWERLYAEAKRRWTAPEGVPAS